MVGSNFTVNAASYIAGKLGMTERLIGLTIVAFGTSLPELVTSCTAAKKGQTDIAIGNIVGSNICNILFVAGTTMLITPVQRQKEEAHQAGRNSDAGCVCGIFCLYYVQELYVADIK